MSYSRKTFLTASAAATSWLAFGKDIDHSSNKKPNILFILADDLGWMDTGAYGSQFYETPVIDQLAKEGMLFTNAYTASPLCSPTRASILTGQYPARLRITTPACHLPPRDKFIEIGKKSANWQRVVTPQAKRYLPLETQTIAETLRDNGYATSFFGKWHLGHKKWWADQHGFDYMVGGTQHPGPPSFWSPYSIPTIPDKKKGEYLSDRIHNDAITYLKNREDKNKPFFMCMWEFAVHAPFGGRKALMEKYKNKKDPRGKQASPTMGSMIEAMDTGIGRLLKTIKEVGEDDNTIIIFYSDNGGNMYNLVDNDIPPTNNAPLRSGKGNNYEGGVRVPCIIKWPGVIEAGSKSNELISSVDFYSTLMTMAGLKMNPEKTDDGKDITPILKGDSFKEERAIFSDFPHYTPATGNLPNVWVRKGEFKLMRFYGRGPGIKDEYELYNLEKDIGERNNLAAKLPEVVKKLSILIDEHLENIDAVMPIPNPAYIDGKNIPKPNPKHAPDRFLRNAGSKKKKRPSKKNNK